MGLSAHARAKTGANLNGPGDGLVWSGLVWSGLVWSGLAWPGWAGLASLQAPGSAPHKQRHKRVRPGLAAPVAVDAGVKRRAVWQYIG